MEINMRRRYQLERLYFAYKGRTKTSSLKFELYKQAILPSLLQCKSYVTRRSIERIVMIFRRIRQKPSDKFHHLRQINICNPRLNPFISTPIPVLGFYFQTVEPFHT